ncbi:MAG: hypothetical protein PQJ46_08020 [Spirochaetales bacterium]|nr:hypothetical protein [Spirochaetales bacterium]
MIKKYLCLIILFFNAAVVFSLDLYMYEFSPDVIYAVAIEKSADVENEYKTGIIEINPSGDQWWTISTHCVIDENNNIISLTDLNFPKLTFKGANLDVTINSNNNVVLCMHKVDKILYKGCEVELPDVFIAQ